MFRCYAIPNQYADIVIPTQQMTQYYAAFAHGKFGLIFTEGTYTDLAYSQGYLNQPAIVTDQQIRGWQRVTEAVHTAGGVIFVHASKSLQSSLQTLGWS